MSILKNSGSIAKEACCGCGACELACPQKCIKRVDDPEGFAYPEINLDLCIDCGLCYAVCPMEKQDLKVPQRCLSLVHKSGEVVASSSSGGAFTALSQAWGGGNTVFYGCTFGKNRAFHSCCEDVRELNRFSGSKYMQSELGLCYSDIKKHLSSKEKVVFSGTPCQTAGLYGYLGKAYENLLTIDFVCHGVPSQKLFKKYLADISRSRKKSVTGYKFRVPLSFAGKVDPLGIQIQYDDSSVENRFSFEDEYMHSYLKGLMNRPCCYSCPFAQNGRASDFTIGDFWGIENNDSTLRAEKGVSLVLVNTDKALQLVASIAEIANIQEWPLESALANNRQLQYPFLQPEKRHQFVGSVLENDFLQVADEFVSPTHPLFFLFGDLFGEKTKNAVKKLLKRGV